MPRRPLALLVVGTLATVIARTTCDNPLGAPAVRRVLGEGDGP